MRGVVVCLALATAARLALGVDDHDHNSAGIALIQTGDVQGAISEFELHAAAHPYDAQGFANLAQSKLQLATEFLFYSHAHRDARVRDAMAALRRAVSIDPYDERFDAPIRRLRHTLHTTFPTIPNNVLEFYAAPLAVDHRIRMQSQACDAASVTLTTTSGDDLARGHLSQRAMLRAHDAFRRCGAVIVPGLFSSALLDRLHANAQDELEAFEARRAQNPRLNENTTSTARRSTGRYEISTNLSRLEQVTYYDTTMYYQRCCVLIIEDRPGAHLISIAFKRAYQRWY